MKYLSFLSLLLLCVYAHATDDNAGKSNQNSPINWKHVDTYVDRVTHWPSYQQMFNTCKDDGLSPKTWQQLWPKHQTQIYTLSGLAALSILSPRRAPARLGCFCTAVLTFKMGRDAPRV
ncbi:MAG: hypothetical protein WD055_01105 [Candidatus Dependentiae bacterium]